MSNSAQINFVTKDEFKQLQSHALDVFNELVFYANNPSDSVMLSSLEKAVLEATGTALEDINQDNLYAFIVASLTKTYLMKGNQ